jgi:hypothetical protein
LLIAGAVLVGSTIVRNVTDALTEAAHDIRPHDIRPVADTNR